MDVDPDLRGPREEPDGRRLGRHLRLSRKPTARSTSAVVPGNAQGRLATVFDDGEADVLTGDEGLDWFLFNVDGDGDKKKKDKATDLRPPPSLPMTSTSSMPLIPPPPTPDPPCLPSAGLGSEAFVDVSTLLADSTMTYFSVG